MYYILVASLCTYKVIVYRDILLYINYLVAVITSQYLIILNLTDILSLFNLRLFVNAFILITPCIEIIELYYIYSVS